MSNFFACGEKVKLYRTANSEKKTENGGVDFSVLMCINAEKY